MRKISDFSSRRTSKIRTFLLPSGVLARLACLHVWPACTPDLPGKPLKDVCGVQRLPNGNTILTSFRAKSDAPRMIEVTPDKKIVWTYTHPKRHGVYHFQILNTNGKRLHGRPLR